MQMGTLVGCMWDACGMGVSWMKVHMDTGAGSVMNMVWIGWILGGCRMQLVCMWLDCRMDVRWMRDGSGMDVRGI